MKNVLRLNESDFKMLIEKCVKAVLTEERQKFDVVEMNRRPNTIDMNNITAHCSKDRPERINRYIEEDGDLGVPAFTFVVDTGHRDGAEEHTITTKGYIIFQNSSTKEVISLIAARPRQIKRYWLSLLLPLPNHPNYRNAMRYAFEHERKGMNEW